METFIILVLIVILIIQSIKGSGKSEMMNELFTINRRLEKIYKEIQELKTASQFIPKPKGETAEDELIKRAESKLESQHVITEQLEEKQEKLPVDIQERSIEKITESEPPKPLVTNIPPKPIPAPIMEDSEGFWTKLMRENPDMEKFVGENLLSKIAIVILVLGISFFVKYAIDQNWINETARVAIGILAGIILLGFSQYLHRDYKAFSSILVAGAITVFYFTIGYGFHVYQLYSQTTAFIIMVIITAFSSLLSLYYDRQELAVLSTIGGFAVPFMVSTGDGNYVVLFTYLLILNLGLLILSYFKSWDIVKMVSFAFTFIIYGAWYINNYPAISHTAHNNALLFITLFYLLYLVMNVLDVVKNRPIHLGFKIGFLFVNTFLTYAITMNILHEFYPNLKGLYTFGMAIINLILTYLVYKRAQDQKSVLYLLLGMTLLLATITIPIQFKGHYITIFWAAEAAIFVWLSLKTKQHYLLAVSLLIFGLTCISLVMDWTKYDNGFEYAIIANSIFLTGIFVCASLYASWYLYKDQTEKPTIFILENFDSKVFLLAGLFITYLVGFMEVQYQASQYVSTYQKTPLLIYHLIFTTLAALVLCRMSRYALLAGLGLAVLNLLIFILHAAYLPFNEMASNLYTNDNSLINFYANFIYLVCLALSIYSLKTIYSKAPNLFIMSKDKLITIFLLFILFIVSNQLLMYILEYNLSTCSIESYFDLKTQLYKVLFPIVWGLLSFLYLAYGIRNKMRIVRIVSLCLILITVAKLFLYDIRDVSEGGKILAFILLGVLMLIMAFMYQKIKTLITDDTDAPAKD